MLIGPLKILRVLFMLEKETLAGQEKVRDLLRAT